MKLSEIWAAYASAHLPTTIDPTRAHDAWNHLKSMSDLDVITQKDLREYVASRTVAAPSTVNRELAVLSSCLRWALRNELISQVPHIGRCPEYRPKKTVLDISHI